ncbi:hypothetical protein L1887_57437 [Cichorium endivia]|nr:hypothetical protein L1887_57437 [Cichorium endivia]
MAGDDQRVGSAGVDRQQGLVETAVFLGLGKGADEFQVDRRAARGLGFTGFLGADQADELKTHGVDSLSVDRWVEGGSGDRFLGATQGVAVVRHGQAEVVAQGLAFVFATQQAALLQHRHHQLGKALQAVRQQGIDDETVRRLVFEPVLHGVGHVLGGADEVALRRGEAQRHLAQGQAFLAGDALELVGRALVALAAEVAEIGEGRVEVMAAEVARASLKPSGLTKIASAWRAAKLRPSSRGAGLEDQRLALARAGDVQWALDLEEFALVIQGVELVRIEELATLLVAGEGVVLPGIPQALHDLHVLLGDAIALGMGRVLGLAEVVGGAGQPRGEPRSSRRDRR